MTSWLVVAAAVTALSGQQARQLDFLCQGHTRQGDVVGPFAQRIRLDLEKGFYCIDSCATIEVARRITDNEYVLSEHMPGRHPMGVAVKLMLGKGDVEYVSTNYDQSIYIMGRCAKADFSGFPAKSRRSFIERDRALGHTSPSANTGALLRNPDWIRRPTAEDFARHYPDRAQRTETNGVVDIRCTVAASGILTACKAVSEQPANYAFADAALKMSRIYRMKPRNAKGEPVEGRTVVVRLRFNRGS